MIHSTRYDNNSIADRPVACQPFASTDTLSCDHGMLSFSLTRSMSTAHTVRSMLKLGFGRWNACESTSRRAGHVHRWFMRLNTDGRMSLIHSLCHLCMSHSTGKPARDWKTELVAMHLLELSECPSQNHAERCRRVYLPVGHQNLEQTPV